MDNQRLLIWAFFAMMVWITYQTWVQDYAPNLPQPVAEQGADAISPPAVTGGADDIPELSDAPAPGSAEAVPAAPGDTQDAATGSTAPTISITTDVFNIQISTQGGTLQGATLNKYPVEKDRPDELVRLLDTAGRTFGLIESGVRAAGGAAEATHLQLFTADRSSYELGDADELVVPLTWSDASGLKVEKRYRFTRGGYAIGLEQIVTNGSATEWRGAEYVRIKRRSQEVERSMFNVDSYSFDGPIIYDGEKSEKLKRDDLLDDGKYEYTAQQGWFGSIEHHFLRAVVPTPGVDY